MNKGLAFLFILCFYCLRLTAQKAVVFEGKLVDSRSNFPIPYATIKLLKKNLTTRSNVDGIFVLNITASHSDTLLISSLGFSNLKVAVSTLNKINPVIKISENAIGLSEITVSPLKATTIIKKAIKASQKRNASPIILTGYYKEVVKRDSLFSKYADGIISYNIQTVHNRSPKITVRVYESRTKEIVLPKEEDKMNGLNTPINIDDLGAFSNATLSVVLDSLNFNAYKYKLVENEDGSKPIYIIDFEPVLGSKKALYKGKLYIDKEKSLIIGLDYRVAPISIPYLKSISILGFKVSTTSISLSLRYKVDSIENYYLSYVGKGFGMSVMSKKYHQFNEFKSEFWVTQFQTKNCVDFSDRYTKNALYKRGTNYNTEFWNKYDFVGNTEEELKFLK